MSDINLFQSILLGAVEGATEFLPISSTGHLIIAQKLMGIPVNSFFTIVVQSGAIMAAVFYFWKKIITLSTKHQKALGYMALGLLPAIILGFFFKKQLESLEASVPAIIFTTIVGGLAFWLVEKYMAHKTHKTLENATLIDYLTIGFFQAISLIPGTSRSGVTITGGTYRGIKIQDAIEISFIMGIPLLLLATLYKLVTFKGIVSTELLVNTGAGTITAFVVGLAGIKLTLGLLQKYGFKPFMFYRLGLAAFLFIALKNGWVV